MKRPRKEYFEEVRHRDEAVWHMCHYLKMWKTTAADDRPQCSRCPRSYEDKHYGTVIKSCRLIAEEHIVVAMEALAGPEAAEPPVGK